MSSISIPKIIGATVLSLVPLSIGSCKQQDVDTSIVTISKTDIQPTGNLEIDGLVNKLLDYSCDSLEERIKAANDLGKTKNNLATKALVYALLNDKDEVVQGACAYALGKLGNKEAIPALKKILSEKSFWNLGMAAATALASMGDEEAKNVMYQFLEEGYYYETVVRAVVDLNDKGAIPHLIDNLLKLAGTGREGKSYLDAVTKISREDGIKVLIDKLNSNNLDDEKRHFAIYLLGRLEAKEALPLLIPQYLKHIDPQTRAYTVMALGRIGGPGINNHLREMLKDSNDEVQWRTAISLVWLKDIDSVPKLMDNLNDESMSVRCHTAWALGEFGDKRATKALCERLKYDDEKYVRIGAAEALGKIQDKAALETLKEVQGILNQYQGSIELKNAVQGAIDLINSKS